MHRSLHRVILASLGFVLTCAFLGAAARAHDHMDAPLVAQDLGGDIGDVFFFLDPNDNNFAVLAVTVHGLINPNQNANTGFFDSSVRLLFAIENTGNAATDASIIVTHSKQTSRAVPQKATIRISRVPGLLPDGREFRADTTLSRAAFGPIGPPTFGGGSQADQAPAVTTDIRTSISYFGGLIDEPFFFDLGAELAYRASRFANQTNPAILTRGRDSLAGHNTMAVCLRVPMNLLNGSAAKVVGLTVYAQRQDISNAAKTKFSGDFVNVDRMAIPGVNTILTSYSLKNRYNRAKPIDDKAGDFAADIVNNLTAMQTGSTSIEIIKGLAVNNGDLLRLDTSIPNTGAEGGKNPEAGFPNGRRPNDDVVDTLLTLINNRVFQGDAVDDNELPMRDSFPFFAQPHMPFPPGADDLTRN